MAGTILIIVAVIILIVGAFVSLHFWFHVFFVLPEAVTSTPTPLTNFIEHYQSADAPPKFQET
jgi:hypothetical protein